MLSLNVWPSSIQMSVKNQWCLSAGPGTQLVALEASVPDLHTLTPAVPVSVSLPQPQTTLPITIQGCPQVPHLQICDYICIPNLYSALFLFQSLWTVSYFLFI